MITYTTSKTISELEGILHLQKLNLPQQLNAAEINSQGFVTVDHSYESLEKLNDYEKHVIARDGDKVIGYVLAMTKESKHDIPILIPMFDLFDTLSYQEKKISAHNYIVVGQVCVAREYRGQGILDDCYATYKKFYGHKYDFAITEIANKNRRSLNAHKRIGFKEVHSYTGPDQIEWVVVIWDWKNDDR
jgi:L-amino acid N-acyltransferase YncA